MLLDFQMPHKNGIEVILQVKRLIDEYQTKNTKIKIEYPKFVVLTAFKTKAFVQYAESIGIQGVYEKPINIGTLEEILSGISLEIELD